MGVSSRWPALADTDDLSVCTSGESSCAECIAGKYSTAGVSASVCLVYCILQRVVRNEIPTDAAGKRRAQHFSPSPVLLPSLTCTASLCPHRRRLLVHGLYRWKIFPDNRCVGVCFVVCCMRALHVCSWQKIITGPFYPLPVHSGLLNLIASLCPRPRGFYRVRVHPRLLTDARNLLWGRLCFLVWGYLPSRSLLQWTQCQRLSVLTWHIFAGDWSFYMRHLPGRQIFNWRSLDVFPVFINARSLLPARINKSVRNLVSCRAVLSWRLWCECSLSTRQAFFD